MKILKTLLSIALVLLGVFLIGGICLPKTHKIARTVEIKAPDSLVFQYVSDFQNFKNWNPWEKVDPSAQTTIMGSLGEPGYTYAWKGEKVGKGKIELIKSMPNQFILQELIFYMPSPSLHQSNFYLESSEMNSTKITWTMEGKNNSFFERWLYTVMMNRMIGKDYEEGLQNLKTILEK